MSEIERQVQSVDPVVSPELMILRARDRECEGGIGRLLELYRNFLMVLAQTHMNRRVSIRGDASDVVQETFLEAHRDFDDFRGTTEKELIAWLRKILVRSILDHARMQRAHKRDINRVQSLEAAMELSSHVLGNALFAGTPTPSEHLHQREQSVLVADAIATLTKDQQLVIIQRQIHQRAFQDIANDMNKSSGAIRMIWLRGLEKLRQIMKEQENEA